MLLRSLRYWRRRVKMRICVICRVTIFASLVLAGKKKERKKKQKRRNGGYIRRALHRCFRGLLSSLSLSFSLSTSLPFLFLRPSLYRRIKNSTLVTNDPHPVRVTISRREFALLCSSMRRINSGVGMEKKRETKTRPLLYRAYKPNVLRSKIFFKFIRVKCKILDVWFALWPHPRNSLAFPSGESIVRDNLFNTPIFRCV